MEAQRTNNRKPILEEIGFFLRPWFLLPLLVTSVISFGYSILHPAIGVDDLLRSRYVADGFYITVNRPGSWLVMWISEKLQLSQTGLAVLIAIFMAVAAVKTSMLLRREAKDRLPRLCYTVFACLFVSYPLAVENFVYADTGFWIALGYALIPVSLMLCAPTRASVPRRLLRLGAAALLCAFCVSMFQSLATVFVCLAGAALVLNGLYDPDTRFSRILLRGMTMAGVLVAAVILVSLVSRALIEALHLTRYQVGSQQIYWLSGSVKVGPRLVSLAKHFVRQILVPSLFYAPLAELTAAYFLSLAGCVYALVKRRAAVILPIFVMMLSTVLMLLVQGYFVGYRLFQAFAPYVAFTGMLLTAGGCALLRKKWAGPLIGALCLCLALGQALQLRSFFRLDDLRYQEEKLIAEAVIDALEADPAEREKPVAFVGRYALSPGIMRRGVVTPENWLYAKLYNRILYLYDEQRYMNFPVNSLLDWGVTAFEEHGNELIRYFSYLGCDGIRNVSNQQYAEALVTAEEMPIFPEPGAIVDAGDYRIVKLGPPEGWRKRSQSENNEPSP